MSEPTLMFDILTGFAAVVFVLVSGFSVYTCVTTPADQVPGSLVTRQAKAIYYWGLIVMIGSLVAVVGFVLSWVGMLLRGTV